jgi:hypothetical protein
MAYADQTGNRVTKWIRWIARIWGGLVLLVALLIFAGYAWSWVTTGEADPHAVEDYPPIENLPPLLTFLAALGLGIAWRWEGLGGAIAVVSQLVTLPVLLIHWPIAEGFPRYLVAPYGTWMLVAIPGILFLVCWWRSRGLMPPDRGA